MSCILFKVKIYLGKIFPLV